MTKRLLSDGLQALIVGHLPHLHPQPVCEHVEHLLEPEQARKDIELEVIRYHPRGEKLEVEVGTEGPFYEPLWKDNKGRPYIRVFFHNAMYDVFLCPPNITG